MTDYKRPSEMTVDKNKGEAMINKVLSSIRRIGGESSFEGYLKELHRHSSAGVPTMDEARKDFRESMRWSVR